MSEEGIIIINVTDYQAALEVAGRTYRQRYGKPPTSVALPRAVDPASLKLWTLSLSDKPAAPGTLMVFGSSRRETSG